jgi:hypothetical protein
VEYIIDLTTCLYISVRNTKYLREVIIPLISNKARELETLTIYLDLLSSNEHGDQLFKFAFVLKELNAKRLVGHKSDRLDLIIDWLKA